MSSATPTPSPRPNWLDAQTPRRPATRAAHTRVNSYSTQSAFSPRPPRDSPRYNSSGEYATVDVSYQNFSSRGHSASSHRPKKRDRAHSFTYVRSSTPYGESDEDEIIETTGHTYVLPAQSRSRGQRHLHNNISDYYYDGAWYTNTSRYSQDVPYYTDAAYSRDPSHDAPRPIAQPRPPTSLSHARRASASIPQRPSTVRPTTVTAPRPVKPPAPPKATEEDAARHKIPVGYSLKNWDPREEPILLLGSVFDANSLGKWIYDWTVYHQGPATPISDMAGEMWLLLIQLAGKVKRAEETVGRVRTPDNRDLVEEFIEAGERLTEKLRSLLKACEAPMLKSAKRKQAGLGKNAGVEFVETLFGRDRELDKTEKFMQNVRLFNLRFDANCEEILRNPTK
jgi:hypothetical protein